MRDWTNFNPNQTFYEYTTSVSEINNEETPMLTVYPNPAISTATIVLNLSNTADVNVVIIDMSGRIVKSVFAGKKTGAQSFEVNVEDMNSGLYFVVVNTGSVKQTARLSIVK